MSLPAPPPEARRRGLNARSWNWLLLLPFVATLYPPFYNRRSPKLFSIPFFYWWQIACIAVGVSCTLVVYLATRGER